MGYGGHTVLLSAPYSMWWDQEGVMFGQLDPYGKHAECWQIVRCADM